MVSRLCFRPTSFFVEVMSFCTFLFVLPKAPLISSGVSRKVWEGPRCRLSQGWQLGAVLTCSLIKSSWARVHLWQGLCQAADRWEAVLNANVTPSVDRQEMPPLAVPTTAVIQYLIYGMIWHEEGESGQPVCFCLFLLDWVCMKASCGLRQRKHNSIRFSVQRMGIGWGGAELVRARILTLFICIRADLPTGAQREA